MPDLLIRKTADISPCGLYRYRLTREWGDGPLLPFVMLNPSTADAEVDDPTIRRCMGFARREGFSGIVVTNVFAFRATNPDDLRNAVDPLGPRCHEITLATATYAIANNVPIVCAWGAWAGDVNGTAAEFVRAGAVLKCLGRTKSGCPRHPLYVKGDATLEDFP
jgi:hypothetical protein